MKKAGQPAYTRYLLRSAKKKKAPGKELKPPGRIKTGSTTTGSRALPQAAKITLQPFQAEVVQ